MAERDRAVLRYAHSSEWQMSNATFFTAFVAIAAVLTILALIVR